MLFVSAFVGTCVRKDCGRVKRKTGRCEKGVLVEKVPRYASV